MKDRKSPSTQPEGRLDAANHRFLVVAARFHGRLVDLMLESARACLGEHGASADAVEVVSVPGAWELPQAARAGARTGRFDAVVALGCVIRGETPHFEYISGETARGLADVARDTGVPVVFGVLTTETEAQAVERADPHGQDKGREAALAALEMAHVVERFRKATP